MAMHPRLTGRYLYRDVLDHYLEILAVKPGALRGAAALAEARQSGVFTAVHYAFWETAVAGHGQADGTRALIEVLLLPRREGLARGWRVSRGLPATNEFT